MPFLADVAADARPVKCLFRNPLPPSAALSPSAHTNRQKARQYRCNTKFSFRIDLQVHINSKKSASRETRQPVRPAAAITIRHLRGCLVADGPGRVSGGVGADSGGARSAIGRTRDGTFRGRGALGYGWRRVGRVCCWVGRICHRDWRGEHRRGRRSARRLARAFRPILGHDRPAGLACRPHRRPSRARLQCAGSSGCRRRGPYRPGPKRQRG